MSEHFSETLFSALVGTVNSSEVSLRVLLRVIMGHLPHAKEIWEIILRRIKSLSLDSPQLKAMFLITDSMLRSAPMVFSQLVEASVAELFEQRVMWDGDNPVKATKWTEDMILGWNGLITNATWRAVYNNIQSRRTRKLLETAAEEYNVSDDVEIFDPPASRRQIQQLEYSWAELQKVLQPVSNVIEEVIEKEKAIFVKQEKPTALMEVPQKCAQQIETGENKDLDVEYIPEASYKATGYLVLPELKTQAQKRLARKRQR